jgi:hypothetical protein
VKGEHALKEVNGSYSMEFVHNVHVINTSISCN